MIAELVSIWQYTLSIKKYLGKETVRIGCVPITISHWLVFNGHLKHWAAFPYRLIKDPNTPDYPHNTVELLTASHLRDSFWPSPSFRVRGRVCYCGWTLEGSVRLSVLCRCCCGCGWCCCWCEGGKVLCCSGKAAERMSCVEGLPCSSLDVCRNCCGAWVS